MNLTKKPFDMRESDSFYSVEAPSAVKEVNYASRLRNSRNRSYGSHSSNYFKTFVTPRSCRSDPAPPGEESRQACGAQNRLPNSCSSAADSVSYGHRFLETPGMERRAVFISRRSCLGIASDSDRRFLARCRHHGRICRCDEIDVADDRRGVRHASDS